MPSLATLIAIGVGGLVLYAILRAGFAALEQGGRDAQRASRAQADLRIAQEQGAVIAQQRTVKDAQDRLGNGSF